MQEGSKIEVIEPPIFGAETVFSSVLLEGPLIFDVKSFVNARWQNVPLRVAPSARYRVDGVVRKRKF